VCYLQSELRMLAGTSLTACFYMLLMRPTALTVATALIVILISVALTPRLGMLFGVALIAAALAACLSVLFAAATALTAAPMRPLMCPVRAFMGAGTMFMGARSMASCLLLVVFLLVVRRLTMVMRRRFMVRSRLMMGQTAHPTDFRHMLTILAHRLATFASGFARFFRVKLMGMTAFMDGFAALAGDFSLLVIIHRREAALAITLVPLSHRELLFCLASSWMPL